MINSIKKYRKIRSDGLILPIKYENLHRRCEELLGGFMAESPGLNTKQMINRIKKYRKLRSDGLILPIKYENLLLNSNLKPPWDFPVFKLLSLHPIGDVGGWGEGGIIKPKHQITD